MPEITTETTHSSSPVSSCYNVTLPDGKDSDNAKCLDNSFCIINPLPVSDADTKPKSTSLFECNGKRDSIASKSLIGECPKNITNEKNAKSAKANESLVLIHKSSPPPKLFEKDMDCTRKGCASCNPTDVNNIHKTDNNVDIAQVKCCALPITTTSSSSFINTPSSSLQIHPTPLLSNIDKHKSATSSLHSTCEFTSQNVFRHPSFSKSQDEYFHEMITRIGTDINPEDFVPDNSIHSLPSEPKRNTCVTVPQTIQAAECISTTENRNLRKQQILPHERSDWSSTSSVATRPKADKLASKSTQGTKFGTTKKQDYAGPDYIEYEYIVGDSQFQDISITVASETKSRLKPLSPKIHHIQEETSTDIKENKTFKSTAV